MTTVKIQRPVFTNDVGHINGGGPWLIYDKFRARECTLDKLPLAVLRVFDSSPKQSPGHFKQYFDDALWINDSWDLSQVSPVTRRLIW